jgi:hypothetical protein
VRMTKAHPEGNHFREGKCPNCGHHALKISRGDDGRTLVWCYCCRDKDAIVAALRKLGYTTTPNWRPGAPKRRGANIQFNGRWDQSPSYWALVGVEFRIDSLISLPGGRMAGGVHPVRGRRRRSSSVPGRQEGCPRRAQLSRAGCLKIQP